MRRSIVWSRLSDSDRIFCDRPPIRMNRNCTPVRSCPFLRWISGGRGWGFWRRGRSGGHRTLKGLSVPSARRRGCYFLSSGWRLARACLSDCHYWWRYPFCHGATFLVRALSAPRCSGPFRIPCRWSSRRSCWWPISSRNFWGRLRPSRGGSVCRRSWVSSFPRILPVSIFSSTG